MEIDELKRRLRKLKHLEIRMRYGNQIPPYAKLLWDSFFDLHESTDGKSKYSLESLLKLSKDEYKRIVDEYLSFVYNAVYRETSETDIVNYDPNSLIQLGLPFDANEHAIKCRFRTLAKLYHPDTGGDAEQFISLMNTYRKLIRK